MRIKNSFSFHEAEMNKSWSRDMDMDTDGHSIALRFNRTNECTTKQELNNITDMFS